MTLFLAGPSRGAPAWAWGPRGHLPGTSMRLATAAHLSPTPYPDCREGPTGPHSDPLLCGDPSLPVPVCPVSVSIMVGTPHSQHFLLSRPLLSSAVQFLAPSMVQLAELALERALGSGHQGRITGSIRGARASEQRTLSFLPVGNGVQTAVPQRQCQPARV